MKWNLDHLPVPFFLFGRTLVYWLGFSLLSVNSKSTYSAPKNVRNEPFLPVFSPVLILKGFKLFRINSGPADTRDWAIKEKAGASSRTPHGVSYAVKYQGIEKSQGRLLAVRRSPRIAEALKCSVGLFRVAS